MNPQAPGILVVCIGATDAEMIAVALREEFPNAAVSLDPMQTTANFERVLPDVLLLAHRQLEQAQACLAALREGSELARTHAHRTLVLCHADQTSQTFDLCKRGVFDDYLKFWPQTFDVHQLPMSVRGALQQLRAAKALGLAATELMEYAKRTAAAESLLVPGGANPAGAVQVIQRRMFSLLAPAGADGRGFATLASSAERLQALAADSRELRKHTEAHLDLARTLRDQSPHAAKAKAAGPISVLIVEDDAFQQKMLECILVQEQFACEAALTGQQATAALARHVPSLVLLDYELPDCNGISWLIAMRENPMWAHVPVIMLTGNSDKQVVVTSLQAGASDFIVKPVDPAKLREKIRRFTAVAH